MRARRSDLLGLGLLNQHDWDAVDDWVQDLALGASEMVGLFELHLGVAFGASEDFEQLLRDHVPHRSTKSLQN